MPSWFRFSILLSQYISDTHVEHVRHDYDLTIYVIFRSEETDVHRRQHTALERTGRELGMHIHISCPIDEHVIRHNHTLSTRLLII